DEIGTLIGHRSNNVDKTTTPWTIVGPAAAIATQIQNNPDTSIEWGGKLLSYYDQQLTGIGVPRGTDLYFGLLKAMHSTPWTRIWAIHVRHALGYWPATYAEFYDAIGRLQDGTLQWDPETKKATRVPSCSALQILERTGTFAHPDDAFAAVSALSAITIVAGHYSRPLTWLTPISTADRTHTGGGRFGGAPGHPPPVCVRLGAVGTSFPDIRFGPPLRGWVVAKSGWGDSRAGAKSGFHAGIDLYRPKGDPVLAMASGNVYFAAKKGIAGNWVGIEHKNGWISRYMHLDSRTVEQGDHVKKGQVIGFVGQTGYNPANAAPHLHLSVLLDRDRVGDYWAKYGKASPSNYPMRTLHGIRYTAVPGEPVVPINEYNPGMAKRMARRGVLPYQKPPPLKSNWPAFFAVAALGTLGFVAVFTFWPE
ncbi:hypothetical protein LCGC14_1112820, partial [marine sediment metagenome]